jgi:predicted ATP-dependent serine protease
MQKQSYTIKFINPELFELTSVEGTGNLEIHYTHNKFSYVKENVGRVININEKGRFNSSEDRHNYYGTSTSTPSKSVQPVKINLTKLDDLFIDDSLFIPLQTGTAADKFLSTDGGFLPGTNVMAAGAPGIGKTTVLLELLSRLHANGKKVLFISAEMNQIDMARYLKRFPHWGQLPIMFLGDYTEQCPKGAIEEVLNQGWDLVLTDSYTEVNDSIKEACNLTRGKTEKWFLDLMDQHNKANNSLKLHTTFVTILQLSKGGVFVGSNKLKHMATAMMHLDWDGNENSGRRFMEFSKNRTGQVNKKLYFDFSNGVQFDEARYARDLFNDEVLQEERRALEGESSAFDKLFGFNQDGIPEELRTAVEL